MRKYLAIALLLGMGSTTTVQAQTCTGETGACHEPRQGEYLVVGSSASNSLRLRPGSSTSYAANFYRTLSVNQEGGRIGHEATLVKQVPDLFRCEITIRSGGVNCAFAGPLLSERQNLLVGKPAKLPQITSRALSQIGGDLLVVPGGLAYFCESKSDCFVQVVGSQFPGGVIGQL